MPLVILSHDLNSVVHMVCEYEKETESYILLGSEQSESLNNGIHKGRNPIDKSIRRTGLSYSRVAMVAIPTLSGAQVVCDRHKQCDKVS